MTAESHPSDSSPQGSSGSRPAPGRVAGIDFGTVRIGVAITDSRGAIASPLENYTRRGPEGDAHWFRRLVADEGIVRFVVGLPVHAHGGESQKSREARRFGEWLRATTNVEVEYFDERYTSVEAEQILGEAQMSSKRRKERLDKLAAQIMLQGWLESTRRGEQPEALE
jgi:putative Holliday junction resolvase